MAPSSAPSSSPKGSRSRLERARRLKTRNPTPFMEISTQGLCSLRDACKFSAEDCVFDLGAGCGRIMAEILERYPCRGVAVEVNPSLARVAAERLSKYGERVRVVAQDLRRVDLREATAVVCFFTSVALEDLKQYLAAALSKGVVLINYAYPVPGWWTVRAPTDGVYKYRIGEHRSRPVLEEAPPLLEKLQKKSNPMSLAPLNTEAPRTWDPSLGWYPYRKRASIDDASSSLASVRASSQCSTASAMGRSRSWSGSRHRPGDNSRPGREDRGTVTFGSQGASHVADEDRAVEMLHRAIDREDAKMLRSAIGLGELSGFEDNLLDSARKQLLRLEALEMLLRARDSRDPEAFKQAISKADVSDLPRSAIQQMKKILHGLEIALAQEEPLQESAALDVEPEAASRRGCVSLPSMQRHRSAPVFFLPGVELNERTTL